MTQEFDDDELTIDLGELFHTLWNKAHIIILAGLIGALAALGATMLLMTPKYTSTTSMYMLTKSANEGAITTGDLQAGSQLTQDYMELTKSRTVLDSVIRTLNLDMTDEELESCIAVENAADTRIMTISVEHEDPEMAQDIADELRNTAGQMIEDIMDIEAVNTIDEASFPTTQSSPSTMKNTLLGAMAGIILAIAVIVLIYLLDDTIKTTEDAEKYLGLNVLASIPLQAGEEKAKKMKRHNSRKAAKTVKKMKK